MGSGIVSTEIDGCLSSYTEVELEAKTHSSPCVGVLHNTVHFVHIYRQADCECVRKMAFYMS